MPKTAPADEPDALSAASKQPFRIRMALWLACGAALGLPVDNLFPAINQQMEVARTTLGGKRLRWTPAQRLLHVAYLKRIPLRMRQIFHWITTPAALIRTVKRFQQRMANSAAEPDAEEVRDDRGLGRTKSTPFCASTTRAAPGCRASLAKWPSAASPLRNRPFAKS